MRILFFDTETNGLPKNFRAPPHDVANWPIILTIGWQLWEVVAGEWTLLEAADRLLKPSDSVIWDTSAEAIHGITRERALAEGSTPAEVFPEIQTLMRTADVVTAHNIAFDKSVLIAEMLRLNPAGRIDWWPRLEYCSCQNTKVLCKLPSRSTKPRPEDPYKMPKLIELYAFLFGTEPSEADMSLHTAVGDVECLVRCFRELVRREHVPIGIWERATRRV